MEPGDAVAADPMEVEAAPATCAAAEPVQGQRRVSAMDPAKRHVPSATAAQRKRTLAQTVPASTATAAVDARKPGMMTRAATRLAEQRRAEDQRLVDRAAKAAAATAARDAAARRVRECNAAAKCAAAPPTAEQAAPPLPASVFVTTQVTMQLRVVSGACLLQVWVRSVDCVGGSSAANDLLTPQSPAAPSSGTQAAAMLRSIGNGIAGGVNIRIARHASTRQRVNNCAPSREHEPFKRVRLTFLMSPNREASSNTPAAAWSATPEGKDHKPRRCVASSACNLGVRRVDPDCQQLGCWSFDSAPPPPLDIFSEVASTQRS